jgi:hypothetical protein
VAEGSGFVKALGFRVLLEGLYLLEADAVTDSTYTLVDVMASSPGEAATPSGTSQAAALPNQPLTHKTPLTAGEGVAPLLDLKPTYLPLIYR